MEKMVVLRSIYRAACFRSSRFAVATAVTNHNRLLGSRSFFSISSPSPSNPPRNLPSGGWYSFALRLGSMRYLSEEVIHMPVINDPEIQKMFKDLMVASWYELPSSVVQDAKNSLSKNTDDKAGLEALKDVLHTTEAVQEFGGFLMSKKKEFEDLIMNNSELLKALETVYERYKSYLDALDGTYLQKKLKTELESKLNCLKT